MPEGRPLPQVASELWELVVAYFKQETLDPLKQLGRFVGFGIVGAFLLGCGVILLSVSALRALQTETGDTFAGDWSWVLDRHRRSAPGRRHHLDGAGQAGGNEMSATTTDKRITKADIQAKLEELRGGVDQGVDQARNITKVVGAVAVGVIVVAAFLYGRRRGRTRQTIVEIRRV
jgi:hypothetical protein